MNLWNSCGVINVHRQHENSMLILLNFLILIAASCPIDVPTCQSHDPLASSSSSSYTRDSAEGTYQLCLVDWLTPSHWKSILIPSRHLPNNKIHSDNGWYQYVTFPYLNYYLSNFIFQSTTRFQPQHPPVPAIHLMVAKQVY